MQQPDPNQPKPEGSQMVVLKGEPLAVGVPWPPSLLAALQRWGTTQPKAPCLTALDTAGKAVYTLTYGKCQKQSGSGLAVKCYMLYSTDIESFTNMLEQFPRKQHNCQNNRTLPHSRCPSWTTAPSSQQRGRLTD